MSRPSDNVRAFLAREAVKKEPSGAQKSRSVDFIFPLNKKRTAVSATAFGLTPDGTQDTFLHGPKDKFGDLTEADLELKRRAATDPAAGRELDATNYLRAMRIIKARRAEREGR